MSEQEAVAKPAKGKRGGRIVRGMVRAMAMVYLGLALLLYFLQERMIFPGARFQGTESARIVPGEGERVVELPLAGGGSVMAYVGMAEGAGAGAEGRPSLIYFYGNGECARFEMGWARRMRGMGFNVVVPDYPGYGMSRGHPSAAGIYATADACYGYLTGVEHVRPGRIGVVGRSLGGAPAIYLASRHPVGALATVSAFRTLGEIGGNVVHHAFPVSLLMRDRMENLGRMKDVTCPTFIAHGTEDELIPFETAGALAHATRGPVRLYPVAGAGHNDIYGVGGEKLIEAMEEFLRGAVGGDGPGRPDSP